MATNDFFAELDEVEAKLEAQEAHNRKVRYWYEEGYVEGNEKDSDTETTSSDSKEVTGATQDAAGEATHVQAGAEAAEDTEAEGAGARQLSNAGQAEARGSKDGEGDASSDDGYEEVVPGSQRGGRRVCWGGLGGRLCLADLPPEEVPPLNDVLAELLLPAGESSASSSRAAGSCPEASDASQQPGWTHSRFSEAAALQNAVFDSVVIRENFMRDERDESFEVRGDAEPVLPHTLFRNATLHRRGHEELPTRTREGESEVVRGDGQTLPGVRRTTAPTQERRRAGRRRQETAEPPRRSLVMMPGSLSGTPLPKAAPIKVTPGPLLKLKPTSTGAVVHVERPERARTICTDGTIIEDP